MSMKKHLRHVLLWIYDKNNQIKSDDAVEEIREVYGHDSIGRMTVFRWLKKFRNGDKNVDDLEDDPRSGRPSKFNEKFVFAFVLTCLAFGSASPIKSEDFMKALSHNSLKCMNDLAEYWKNQDDSIMKFCPELLQQVNLAENATEIDRCVAGHDIVLHCMRDGYLKQRCLKEDWPTVCKINFDIFFEVCNKPTFSEDGECCQKIKRLCDEPIPVQAEVTLEPEKETTTTTTTKSETATSTKKETTTTTKPDTTTSLIHPYVCLNVVSQDWFNDEEKLSKKCPEVAKLVAQGDNLPADDCIDSHIAALRCLRDGYVEKHCPIESWSSVCNLYADSHFAACDKDDNSTRFDDCCEKSKQICDEPISGSVQQSHTHVAQESTSTQPTPTTTTTTTTRDPSIPSIEQSQKCFNESIDILKSLQPEEACPEYGTLIKQRIKKDDVNTCVALHSAIIRCSHRVYADHGCALENWSVNCRSAVLKSDVCLPSPMQLPECCEKAKQLCDEPLSELSSTAARIPAIQESKSTLSTLTDHKTPSVEQSKRCLNDTMSSLDEQQFIQACPEVIQFIHTDPNEVKVCISLITTLERCVRKSYMEQGCSMENWPSVCKSTMHDPFCDPKYGPMGVECCTSAKDACEATPTHPAWIQPPTTKKVPVIGQDFTAQIQELREELESLHHDIEALENHVLENTALIAKNSEKHLDLAQQLSSLQVQYLKLVVIDLPKAFDTVKKSVKSWQEQQFPRILTQTMQQFVELEDAERAKLVSTFEAKLQGLAQQLHVLKHQEPSEKIPIEEVWAWEDKEQHDKRQKELEKQKALEEKEKEMDAQYYELLKKLAKTKRRRKEIQIAIGTFLT